MPGSRRRGRWTASRSSAWLTSILAARRSQAEEFGLVDAVVGTDAGDVIDRTKPDIVFDVVVPAARRDLAMTVFGRGCHLLTEKPMADSLAHAEEIIAAGRASGRLHAVVQNRRYHPVVRRIRRFLEFGGDRRADQPPLRLLHRAAFRRLPRGDGSRPSPRHGDPHLRRGALHGRPGHRPRSICAEWEPAGILVPAGLVGGRCLRVR